jgi:hypothetical protein
MSTQERAVSDASKPMTAADAAKLVKRITVISDGGAEKIERSPVKAGEVLAFRDYGSHVVVVTTDGQKFSSAEA